MQSAVVSKVKWPKCIDISCSKAYADTGTVTYGVVKLVPASIDGVFGISNVMATYEYQELFVSLARKRWTTSGTAIELIPVVTVTSNDSSVADHGVQVVFTIAEFLVVR